MIDHMRSYQSGIISIFLKMEISMEDSKELSKKDNDDQEPIKKHDNPPKKKLSENAIFQIIGLTIPFLYLFGYLYYQGYFSAYGINLGLFPQSADHTK